MYYQASKNSRNPKGHSLLKFREFCIHTGNPNSASLRLGSVQFRTKLNLVIDQFVGFVVPAVQLTDLFTDFLGRMLGSKLSHSLEVYLTACWGHIK